MLRLSYPMRMGLEVTYVCNYRCIHCYNGSVKSYDPKNELTIDELDKLLFSLRGKVFEIAIGGGEPLLKKGLSALVNKHKDYFTFFIATNGSLITDDLLKKFPKEVFFQVSIDGLEKSHNFIRARKDAYTLALRAFKKLLKNGFSVVAGIMICKVNLDEIEELVLKLSAEGIKDFNFLTYIGSDQRLALEKGDFKKINDFFEKVKVENKLKVRDPIFDCSPGVCQAGITSLNINPFGEVGPCCYLSDILGNVRNKNLEEIWNLANFRRYAERVLPRDCDGCAIASSCLGGCLARRKVPTDKDYLCFR